MSEDNIIQPNANERRRVLIESNRKIPPDYQEVEYIESTGTQYLITNIYPTAYTCVSFKFFYKNKSSSYSPYFGSMDRNNGMYTALWNNSNQNNTTIGAYTAANQWTEFIDSFPVYSNTMFIYKQIKNIETNTIIATLNDKTISHSCYFDDTISSKYLAISSYNSTNETVGTRTVSGQWFYFKIYNLSEESLLLNLVPCYRISDNIAGMYDLVSNQFFTNSGTGEFITGPEVYY